jgi:hypothetical protein
MKGDSVEIVVDAGGEIRTYRLTASRAGRRVEVSTGRGVVEVTEVTRTGTPVRTARFMANRVVALVEHPAPQLLEEERTAAGPRPRRGPAEPTGPAQRAGPTGPTGPVGGDEPDGQPGDPGIRAV